MGQACCTLSNPTEYPELVSIEVEAPIDATAPASMTLDAGARDEPCSVAFRSDGGREAGDIHATTTYRAEKANGLEDPIPEGKVIALTIRILPYSWFQLIAMQPFNSVTGDAEFTIPYRLYNEAKRSTSTSWASSHSQVGPSPQVPSRWSSRPTACRSSSPTSRAWARVQPTTTR